MRISSLLVAAAAVLIPTLAAAQPSDPCEGGEVTGPDNKGDGVDDAKAADEPSPPPPPDLQPVENPVPVTEDMQAIPLPVAPEPPAKPEVRFGFYIQPQLKLRQNSAAAGDEDGFRVRRTRLLGKAKLHTHGLDVGIEVEAELSPVFTANDAFVTASGTLPSKGTWKLDAGQMKAPFSHQTMLSDSKLSFVDKPEIASLSPDRQIGLRGNVELPGVPMVQLWGGLFDGEGTNQIQNIDEHFMYVGRVEVHPLGRGVKLAESAFEDQITLGADVMQNTRNLSDTDTEDDFGWSADASAAWHGISGTVEYTQIDHRFPSKAQAPYHANGFVAQAAYLWKQKLEVGARLEEIDRNDSVPVDMLGDPNQSLRYYTGVLSYYHQKHDMKAQLQYSHIQEVETASRTGADITFPNDTLLLQITLRMEQ